MTYGRVTDAMLMWETALGKEQCFERLVRRHAAGLLTFIGRMIGNRHHSEELFQEVILAVWTNRRQYVYPRTFKPWLYKIALNRCRLEKKRTGLLWWSYRLLPDRLVLLSSFPIVDTDGAQQDLIVERAGCGKTQSSIPTGFAGLGES
jgi:DNA-directed RNA polymerase specialized sigma24 family protein